MTTTISNDLKVACEIYRNNINNTPIWHSKLVEVFDGVLEKIDISRALCVLTDWMIIEGHYGKLGNGHIGYVYEIAEESIPMIKELYENYYDKRG